MACPRGSDRTPWDQYRLGAMEFYSSRIKDWEAQGRTWFQYVNATTGLTSSGQ